MNNSGGACAFEIRALLCKVSSAVALSCIRYNFFHVSLLLCFPSLDEIWKLQEKIASDFQKEKQKQHTEKEKDAEVDSSRERVSEKWQEKKKRHDRLVGGKATMYDDKYDKAEEMNSLTHDRVCKTLFLLHFAANTTVCLSVRRDK